MYKLVGIIITIIILLIGGYIVFNRPGAPSQPAEPTSKASPTSPPKDTMTTYQSKQYGFSFDYPTDYIFNETSPDYLLIEKAGGEQYDWTYKVDVEKDIFQAGGKTTDMSFKDFITERVMVGCAADGPGSSISCDKVTKIEPVGLDSGILGLKFSLNQVTTHGKVVENKEIGPFYAFDIAIQTSDKTRAVVFSIADFDKAEDSDVSTLSSIASTLTFK